MNLDLIIPTYNRHISLGRALLSILNAPVPSGHSLVVTVADNNSNDQTRQIVETYTSLFPGRLQYVAATRGQGRSFAVNAGIQATRSELVAFIDDDEELESRWTETVFRAFGDPALDYIGGRYQPVWETSPPSWVDHPHIRTAIGWADFGPIPRTFEDESFDGLPMGGNSIIRRKCFDRVGLYSETLGRTGKRLLGAEDTDMHERLKTAGFHGLYLPDLVVNHHIPASRLSKLYMRRWTFWTAVSTSQMMQLRPESVPQWLGLPRYLYGKLLRSPLHWLRSALARRPADMFNHELTMWRFAGRFYGRHLFGNKQP